MGILIRSRMQLCQTMNETPSNKEINGGATYTQNMNFKPVTPPTKPCRCCPVQHTGERRIESATYTQAPYTLALLLSENIPSLFCRWQQPSGQDWQRDEDAIKQ